MKLLLLKTSSIINFYDFIGIDNYHYSKLCKGFGKFLESSTKIFSVDDFVLCKILEYYPSLYYIKKYKFINISKEFRKDLEDNKYKFLSPFYHINNGIHCGLEKYCKSGNLAMVKYFLSDPGYNSQILNVLELACEQGHLNIVKFIYTNYRKNITKSRSGIVKAVEKGHLCIFDFIYNEFFLRKLDYTIFADFIYTVLSKNHFNILSWAFKEEYFMNLGYLEAITAITAIILIGNKIEAVEYFCKNASEFKELNRIIFINASDLIPSYGFNIIKCMLENGYNVTYLDKKVFENAYIRKNMKNNDYMCSKLSETEIKKFLEDDQFKDMHFFKDF